MSDAVEGTIGVAAASFPLTSAEAAAVVALVCDRLPTCQGCRAFATQRLMDPSPGGLSVLVCDLAACAAAARRCRWCGFVALFEPDAPSTDVECRECGRRVADKFEPTVESLPYAAGARVIERLRAVAKGSP